MQGGVTEPMSSLQKWKFETENKVLIVIFVLTVILKVLHLYLLSITVFFFILINAGLSKLPVLEDLECGLLGGNSWELSIPTIASYTNSKKSPTSEDTTEEKMVKVFLNVEFLM